jgi:hypothetical protein
MNEFTEAFNNRAPCSDPTDAGKAQRVLWQAVKDGDRAMALECVRHGADPRQPNQHGNDALMIAARNSHWPLAEELMEVCGGARQNAWGESALHIVVGNGNPSHFAERAKKLLTICDPAAVNHAGETPLMCAASNGSAMAVIALAKSGGQSARNSSGMSAFSLFAVANAYDEEFHLSAESKAAAHALAKNGGAQTLNNHGESALHLAIECGLPERAQWLSQWCDPFLLDKSGKRPLDLLAKVCQWGLSVERAKIALDALAPEGAPQSTESRSRVFVQAVRVQAFDLAEVTAVHAKDADLAKAAKILGAEQMARRLPEAFARHEAAQLALAAEAPSQRSAKASTGAQDADAEPTAGRARAKGPRL